MTKPKAEASLRKLSRYVRELMDLMELRDWSLDLERLTPADDDAAASIKPIFGRRHAQLRVPVGFGKRKPESIRHTLVHELIHLHVADVWHLTADDTSELDTLLGKPAWTAFWSAWELAMEHAIDGLTSALAPHLPLPPDLTGDPVLDHVAIEEGGLDISGMPK